MRACLKVAGDPPVWHVGWESFRRQTELRACAADDDRLRGGLCLSLLAQSLIGSQSAEGTVEVVEGLPFLEFVVEDLGVVDDWPSKSLQNSSASMQWDRSAFPFNSGVWGLM
jgi:hypothetical protein